MATINFHARGCSSYLPLAIFCVDMMKTRPFLWPVHIWDWCGSSHPATFWFPSPNEQLLITAGLTQGRGEPLTYVLNRARSHIFEAIARHYFALGVIYISSGTVVVYPAYAVRFMKWLFINRWTATVWLVNMYSKEWWYPRFLLLLWAGFRQTQLYQLSMCGTASGVDKRSPWGWLLSYIFICI